MRRAPSAGPRPGMALVVTLPDGRPPLVYFSAMRFGGCQSSGCVGELQWTALHYKSSSLKFAAPPPRWSKLSKGSHHLPLNWLSRPSYPNPTPNPLCRFGRPSQNVVAQDGFRPAD
jgi:hypothetical protein